LYATVPKAQGSKAHKIRHKCKCWLVSYLSGLQVTQHKITRQPSPIVTVIRGGYFIFHILEHQKTQYAAYTVF